MRPLAHGGHKLTAMLALAMLALAMLALAMLCATAPDVPPLPPTADERRDRWARSEPRRRLTDRDLESLGRAQSKRERKGSARLARMGGAQ